MKWRCIVCGQIFEGDEPPVPCPVCGAGADAFERVEEDVPRESFTRNTAEKFLLVGGGVASLEAARAIRARNAMASITIVGAESYAPYNRPALSELLCTGKPCESVALEGPDFYEAQHITLRCGEQVEEIDLNQKRARLASGEQLPFDKLLLATGARPFNPIESEPESVSVLSLRSYDDTVQLAETSRGKRVVLVGGGILGLEAAVSLQKNGCRVTVVEFAPRILPLQTDEAVSEMLADALKGLGIELLCGHSVQKATPAGALLQTGGEIPCDVVVASMGVRSETGLAVQMGLELSRGIVVDAHMHTSHPAVWAAGDCAEYDGRVQALAGAAANMGAAAGASMAGDESEAYASFTPATSLTLGGFSLFSVGQVGGEVAEAALYTKAQPALYRRLFLQQGRLAGALFTGGGVPGAQAVSAVAEGLSLPDALELLV